MRSFSLICRSEFEKLLSRKSAMVGLLFAFLLGVIATTGTYGVYQIVSFSMDPQALGQTLNVDNPNDLMRLKDGLRLVPIDSGLKWALILRNSFVLSGFIVLLVAQSVAGEFQAQTLREDLLRPVSRLRLLGAKWLALQAWIGLSLLATWLPSLLISVVLFRGPGVLIDVSLGFAASGLAELTLASMVFFIALACRSVPITFISVFLLALLSYGLQIALFFLKQTDLIPKAILFAVSEVLPSSCLSVWNGYSGAQWDWIGFAALFGWTVVSLTLSVVQFNRMDIP